jgi:bifunctional ADP-heptose synthase (sugar kinase/adenylyltransferase)
LLCRAQALLESLQPDALLLTRSDEGMSLFDASGVGHFAAQAREVFDVSGAGDTVIAVIASLLAAGAALDHAAAIANQAARLAISKPGTAMVSVDEVLS